MRIFGLVTATISTLYFPSKTAILGKKCVWAARGQNCVCYITS